MTCESGERQPCVLILDFVTVIPMAKMSDTRHPAFLPGPAHDSMMGLSLKNLLPAGVGVVVLVAWTVVRASAGVMSLQRRDIDEPTHG